MNNNRVILKFTGEALSGVGPAAKRPFSPEAMQFLVSQVRTALEEFKRQLQVLIVVGGGNFFRGREVKKDFPKFRAVRAHLMGMNNTVNNGVALRQQFLLEDGMDEDCVRLMNALGAGQAGEPYFFEKAEHHLNNGRLVIQVGGTGVPFFSTDTGAVIRGLELNASLILKCSKSPVCDKNPDEHKDAEFIPRITYQECRERDLGIIDKQAIGTLLEQLPEDRIPIAVFNVFEPGSLLKVLRGRHPRASYISEPGWEPEKL